VALAILAGALGATLAVCSNSQRHLIRARERWATQHALEQAAEYFLLAHPRRLELPEGVLSPAFEADCEVRAIHEELEEPANQPHRGWVLAAYTITLRDQHGREVDQQVIHKIVPENEL